MIASLATAALSLGFAIAAASPGASNRTETAKFTVVPLVPITAISESSLDVPPFTSDVPPTYQSAETTSSPQDYGTTSTAPNSTQEGMSSPIALTSYETAAKPTLYTSSAIHMANTSSRPGSGRIVHTERTRLSLDTPISYPPITAYPSPIALTSYSTAAKPTLPASPIALSPYSSAAGPTLPRTYSPAIVHTEIPAESLDIPPGETGTAPSHGVTPVPGVGNGDEGPSSGATSLQIIYVPTALVTVAPNVIVTMGGFQSTITHVESGQPTPTMLVTTIPSQVVTMSEGQVTTMPMAVFTLPVLPVTMPSGTSTQKSSGGELSESVQPTASGGSENGEGSQTGGGSEDGGNDDEGDSGSGVGSQNGGSNGQGANNEEGGASKLLAGSWRCQLLALAIGGVVLM